MREEKILKFWQEKKIFEKSLDKPAPAGEFVFYEGPPTANGRPGLHHLAPRAFKDLMPRYKTMRGFHVRRKAGWDTHGLPVELAVEKELGLKTKKDIEKFGIAAFNQKCRERVWRYLHEWQKFTERSGFWLDQKDPYVTYQPAYIETLWWIFKEIDKRGLLYRDYKVLPWCPRCGTALSSHELAQGYERVKDPAVYVKFKVKPGQKIGDWQTDDKTFFLAWTTTPWTLPGNVALAVGEKIEYKLFERGGERLIVSATAVAGGAIGVGRGEKRLLVSDLSGLEYEPLYDFSPKNEKSHRVYPADFVTTDEGSGIVHTAVMYGADDFSLGTKVGLPKRHLVGEDGKFLAEAGPALAGKFVKDADNEIIADLERRGLLLAKETIEHDYPFCWRCKTPVIYYARHSWYIAISRLRDRLLSENQQINWLPDHLKEGRFGEWLKEAKDWAISRERYWGTPLPVWQRQDGGAQNSGEYLVVGSLEELKQYTKKSGNRYLVMRHGEAESNTRRILSSRPDNPHHLTETGQAQVRQAARQLKAERIDMIVASNFIRAQETAAILATELGLASGQIVTDHRLGEVNHGDFNLRPVDEYRRYWLSPEERFTKNLPNGENLTEVKQRMGQCLYDLESRFQGKNILLVSHESPIWLLFAAAQGLDVRGALALRQSGDDFIAPAEWRPLPFVPLPHNNDFELDLHRPFIDELALLDESGNALKRVSEVVDVWFDSGAMPFAQDHYPFAAKDQELLYPADFISEAVDQTRGWFYTLLAIAVLLERPAPYRNVISLGHLLDKQGRKMSKSLGNVVDPWLMMERYGADALRFWFYAVKGPGESKNFDETEIKNFVNKFFNPLFNILHFFQTYAGGGRAKLKAAGPSHHLLDRWILSRLNQLIEQTTSFLENYQITEAARLLKDFVSDFSQWYLRLSRERFKADGPAQTAAVQTTLLVLQNLAKVMAPFCPFSAEALYQEVKTEADPESVHLCFWPESAGFDEGLLAQMAQTRKIVSLGLEARERSGIKVRQPLSQLTLKMPLGSEYEEIVQRALNVDRLVVDPALDEPVLLATELTTELKERGELRDLIRTLQDWRKQQGLKAGEQVRVKVPSGKRILVKKYEAELKRAVAASELVFED